MHIVHLTASSFFGGPERQMLGLANALPSTYQSTFLSFPESGCAGFLRKSREAGHQSDVVRSDFPNGFRVINELTDRLRSLRADVFITHGYKSNLFGRPAARRAGLPIISVSRGWTGESWKVRLYDAIDRAHLRMMDHVVCVSEGQADKVRRLGVRPQRMSVIHNAARLEAFEFPDRSHHARLHEIAGGEGEIILAAGRLSPEKGFAVLVESAAQVLQRFPGCRFVLFGEGAERATLERRVAELGIGDRFRMPGLRSDLDSLLPWADLVVLPSFTEGLPNVALEAGAAGVPVVATAVGGTPEVVIDGETGLLVPPGNASALADGIARLLGDPSLRANFRVTAQQWMRDRFSFEMQANAYIHLFEMLTNGKAKAIAAECV